MRFGALRFDGIKESRDCRCSAQTEKHQSEVKCENEIRAGHQETGNTASAELRLDRLNAFAEGQRGIILIDSLNQTAC